MVLKYEKKPPKNNNNNSFYQVPKWLGMVLKYEKNKKKQQFLSGTKMVRYGTKKTKKKADTYQPHPFLFSEKWWNGRVLALP